VKIIQMSVGGIAFNTN